MYVRVYVIYIVPKYTILINSFFNHLIFITNTIKTGILYIMSTTLHVLQKI